jgi:hypothetical protein
VNTTRFYTVEKFLEGAFAKFNTSGGDIVVGGPDSGIVQAFSHYSHCATGQRVMVLNAKGVVSTTSGGLAYCLTGPAVATHGVDEFPAATNGGGDAIRAFMSRHTCSEACQHLGLPAVAPAPAAGPTTAATVRAQHDKLLATLHDSAVAHAATPVSQKSAADHLAQTAYLTRALTQATQHLAALKVVTTERKQLIGATNSILRAAQTDATQVLLRESTMVVDDFEPI